MQCVSLLSTDRNTDSAFNSLTQRAKGSASDPPFDLAFLFSSPHHADRLGELADRLLTGNFSRHVLGCSAESIAGEGQEIEGSTGLCLWAIRFPGSRIRPIRLHSEDAASAGKLDDLKNDSGPGKVILVVGDPFSFAVDTWLERLSETLPDWPVVGGMASGSQVPGGNQLVLDGSTFSEGAAIVAVDGAFTLRTVVSQGCRPIGHPMIVTRREGNVIRELGRVPAMSKLQETFQTLSPQDRSRVRQGLHLGLVINEYQEKFDRGDFLVRNVIGVDPEGGIAITDQVRVGQTVQFHIRDASAATEDLIYLLGKTPDQPPIAGGLLFTCNGRGSRLFTEPHHDLNLVHRRFGDIPVSGFFAMGEIGPIGRSNFLHGFTASLALFSTRPS